MFCKKRSSSKSLIRRHINRSFIISDPNWIDVFQKYVTLRNNIQNDRFFVQWRNGKLHNQAIGYHSIASFPQKIATFLKLPNVGSFTGHVFRRTAATLLVDNGADVLQLKRLGGWKSSAVAEGYVESSLENKRKTAKMLSSSSKTVDLPSISSEAASQEIRISNQTQLQEGLKISVINNNANLTINVYK